MWKSERTMSEHDDTLLDEDLGDEEYDLGNDEEEALLADDYELERQNSYKGEEETDDVLDLGVTDALDDLDGEDENLEFSRSKTDKHIENDFYKDGKHPEVQSAYYEQDENNGYKKEQTRPYEGNSACDSVTVSNNIGKGDLREKLQKNSQKVYVGNGQGLEDDDCEEAKERRNRFQNERTMISPKMNNDIPDTLENVVTSESSRPSSFRGRGRGRATRGYRGGGRFSVQTSGNFNPRFGTARNTTFENQQPVCRPPLLETRPPFLLGVPNNVPQNQQIIYQQNNPPVQPFQQFSPNGPVQGPTSFVDSRPQFNPNQFQGPVGPRAVGPRLDYGPRGSVPGSIQGPAYNCPPNQPPYLHIQPAPFQNPGALIQENQVRPLQNNQGLLLHGNTGGSLLGNPLVPGNTAPLLQGNQALPMQGFPRQQTPSQGPPIQNIPNAQMPSQPPFENRPSFQEPHFDGRPPYDSRSTYTDQVPSSQFNNSNTLPLPQQQTSNIPSVPLPPGHKILINPHFRGAVQPANDARLVWDAQNPAIVQSQLSGSSQFSQSQTYQNQAPFNQSQQGPLQFQQTNYPQNKNDDPYAYFSDVWQENRPQKTQSISPSKQYTLESNYSRESNYNDCGNKYKSESQWEQRDSYQEDRRSQQSYRDRDLPPRPRNDHIQKSRSSSSSTYRGDSYDQSHNQRSPSSRSINPAIRGVNRIPQKRISDPSERGQRDTSPKRMKPSNTNLQEVRTVDMLNHVMNERKDEDNDPEMREYRKKMEEQKRLREKILREKENRRKMAAMEKQNEEIKNEASATVAEGSQQDTKPVSVLMGVVKDAAINKGRSGVARGRGRPVNAQTTEATERTTGVRIVRTIQTVQSNEQVDSGDTKDENSAHTGGQSNDVAHTKQLSAQPGTRRVVIQKPLTNSQKIATTIQKTVSNLQKGQGVSQHKLAGSMQSMTQKTQNQQAALKKSSAFGQKVVSTQRIIAQKTSGNIQKTVINVHEVTSANAQKVIVNTQNNQRVVLQKASLQPKKLSEIKTNTVRLENLAASTSETQIRRMCQGIGTIESIHMGEGSATIVFKTQSAAMVFHKKYQRKMLDLSLITVRLVPQTGGNKAVTAVAKKS